MKKMNGVRMNVMTAALVKATDEAISNGVNPGKVGKHVLQFKAAHNMPINGGIRRGYDTPRDAGGYIGMNMGVNR